MGWAGAAAVAAPVIGGLFQADAAKDAARIQANSANYGIDVQKQMFDTNRALLNPFVSTGTMAMSDLAKFAGVTGSGVDHSAPGGATTFTPDNFFLDPSYSFIKQQQEEGLLNNRSAMGGVLSGNTLTDLAKYDTGLASTEYNNAFNRWRTGINDVFTRLSSIMGTGANAAGMTAGLGQNVAGSVAELGGQGANAGAAGLIGSTNALVGGATGGLNNYLLMRMMSNPGGGGLPSPAGAPPPGAINLNADPLGGY